MQSRKLLVLIVLLFTLGIVNAQDTSRVIRLLAKENNLWGYVDQDGQVAIPFEYSRANPFDSYGVAKVEKDGQFMIISKTNETLIRGAYDQFMRLSGQYYKYQIDGLWGISVLKEKYKSNTIYKEPFPFIPEEILAPVYESITVLPENFIMIVKEEAPTYMNFQYNWLWRPNPI